MVNIVKLLEDDKEIKALINDLKHLYKACNKSWCWVSGEYASSPIVLEKLKEFQEVLKNENRRKYKILYDKLLKNLPEILIIPLMNKWFGEC